MKNDKSLVPHLAFPPTLLAVGFLLAGCHYKALRGEKVSHSDLGTYHRGMAPCTKHPHPPHPTPHSHIHTHTIPVIHRLMKGDAMSKEEEVT